MTVPTLLGTGGHKASQTYDSPNYYSNVGLGRSAMASDAVTTETNASRAIRIAGTISYLSWGVEGDGGFDAGLTLAVQKGLSASVLSISISANTTGWVTDTTHSVSVSSGDVLDFATYLSSGATFDGSFYCVSARFDASTGSAQMLTTFGPSAIAPLTTRKFVNFQGILDSGTNVEANHQFYCLADGNWKNLACNLEDNTFNRSTAINNRINGGNGAMAVSIPAGVSGYYEHTSHSDSVDAGDLLDYGIIAASLGGSGSLRMDWIGAHFVADDPNLCMIGGSQGGGATLSGNDPFYSSLFGGGLAAQSTARSTGLFPSTLTASTFANYLTGSSQTPTAGAATFALIRNGAASRLTISSAPRTSGYFIDKDSTHAVAFTTSDTCANQIAVTAGSVIWASVAAGVDAS